MIIYTNYIYNFVFELSIRWLIRNYVILFSIAISACTKLLIYIKTNIMERITHNKIYLNSSYLNV